MAEQSQRFARVPIQASQADVSKCALRVLIALAAYADKAGRAYPSQSTLAKDTGLASRTVRKGIRELIAAALISIERKPARTDAGKWLGSNCYRLHYAEPEDHRGPHSIGPQGAYGDRTTGGRSPEDHRGPPNSPSLSAQVEQRERAPARPPSDDQGRDGAKTIIPSDWQLPECWERDAEAKAASKGVGGCMDWISEADKFKARAHSNATRSADWQAAWALWALRAIERPGLKRTTSTNAARGWDWTMEDDAARETPPTPPPDPEPEPEPDDAEEVAAAVAAVQTLKDVWDEGLALELVKERRRAGSPLHAIAAGARLAAENDVGRDKLSAFIARARKIEGQRKRNDDDDDPAASEAA